MYGLPRTVRKREALFTTRKRDAKRISTMPPLARSSFEALLIRRLDFHVSAAMGGDASRRITRGERRLGRAGTWDIQRELGAAFSPSLVSCRLLRSPKAALFVSSHPCRAAQTMFVEKRCTNFSASYPCNTTARLPTIACGRFVSWSVGKPAAEHAVRISGSARGACVGRRSRPQVDRRVMGVLLPTSSALWIAIDCTRRAVIP